MDKERILGILREHEPELKAAGLLHLRLFGSVARGEGTSFAPEVDWRSVRGIGNRPRHSIDFVIDQIVWGNIQFDLPPLRDAIPAALLRMTNKGIRGA